MMGITAECNAGNDINQIVLVDVLVFSIKQAKSVVSILFQSEKCNIGLHSFVIVFVCTREPILSIFP